MNAETIDVGEGCSEYTLDSGILKRTVDVSSKPDFLKEQSDIGFDYLSEGEKLGWLLTFASDGSKFKVKHRFRPYFCVAIKDGKETDIEVYLRSLYGSQIADIEIVKKEGLVVLTYESTLVGLQKSYLKISFVSVKKLMLVKKSLVHVIGRPKTPLTVMSTRPLEDFVDCSYYLCESDVPYHIRFAIDKDIRCGQWYDISVSCDGIIVDRRIDQLQNPELHTCAFYVYTTELRLKDSEAVCHSIMMISYMIDGHGYLIINREYVGEDLEDLEYTPKPEFKCCFKVKYKGVVGSWFAEMKDVRPSIYVTYKGDCIDWPFLETKAANHGYNMNEELGFRIDKHKGECHAKFACHLDCFAWVKRDSHQPKRKQGLKSVANVLLGFDPVQDIAKDVVCFARHSPHRMTSYYVSNVVSTYYLYMTHVHPFIFSLSTIIRMPPDEVLRERSAVVFERLIDYSGICGHYHPDLISLYQMVKNTEKVLFTISSRLETCTSHSLRKFKFSRDSFDVESGLLSLCPCIEEFILNECGASIDLECFVVKSLSLKRFVLKNWIGLRTLVEEQVIQVMAPRLIFSNVEGAFMHLAFIGPMLCFETASFNLIIPEGFGSHYTIEQTSQMFYKCLLACLGGLCKGVKTIHISLRTTQLISRLGIFHVQNPVCEAAPIFNNLKTIKFTYNEKFLQSSLPTDVVKQLVDEGKEGLVVFNEYEVNLHHEKFLQSSFPTDGVKQLVDEGKEGLVVFNGFEDAETINIITEAAGTIDFDPFVSIHSIPKAI
ncbi:DNA-directed DNA polymerase [Salvia divinorum]|uniref:DNA polymerase epsilon catalytic subunit n=1 Tax=Salvia divinorum TaxID=28513 RepID=A0ABD1GKS7_SALDI